MTYPQKSARRHRRLLLALAIAGAMSASPALADTAKSIDGVAVPAALPTGATADFTPCAKPEWPLSALRDASQGTVTLKFLIGSDGKVLDTALLKSSGFPLLDNAAREGIARCKFKPAIEGGKPVERWEVMQYVWTFEEPTAAEMATAFVDARLRATRGEAAAQYQLATIYLNGAGVPRAPAEAMSWLRKAAEQGLPKAQFLMGTMLAKDAAGAADPVEAAIWFGKAADQGHAGAQYWLGLMLLGANGVPRDVAQARVWLRRSAVQGLAAGQAMIGMELLENSDTQADSDEGVGWLHKAVEQNDHNGQTVLGQCFETGQGVLQDYKQAAALYEKAAAAGVTQAQLALAGLYERGHGVPVDTAKAQALRRAAEQSADRKSVV